MSEQQSSYSHGVQLFVAGKFEDAEHVFREILLTDPRHADSLHLLGVTAAKQGRLDEGAESILTALEQQPNHPVFLNNLAEVYRLQKRFNDAFRMIRQAIEIAPTFPEAHYTLGSVLKETGRDEDAVVEFRIVLELNPRHGKARFALADTLREQGRVPMARNEYQRVVEEHPQWFEPRLNFAVALLELGECEESIKQHLVAYSLRSDYKYTADNLGDIFVRLGQVTSAKEWYRRAREGRPRHWLRELRAEIVGEVIASSNESIDEYRNHLVNTLDRFSNERLTLDSSLLHCSGAEPPMILLYQGREDRLLREKFATFYSRLITPLEPKQPVGKSSVGVVVTKGHEGVFGRCMGDMLHRMGKENVEVTIICSLSGRNILRHLYPHWTMNYLVLPDRVDLAAELIREQGFHRLLYWEVGTDSTNYFIPFFRPCIRQATTWGWPVTTGNSLVNEFISAECLEIEDADSHYVERLIRLRGVPTFYKRPSLHHPLRSRLQMGIEEKDHIYFCPQNVRKIHPDFDRILQQILRCDPKGKVLLIGDEQQSVSNQLIHRFRHTIADVVERLFVLPRMPTEMYLNTLAIADVNLDSLYYGGGANTVFDTIATGTPMVTLPGPFHRSRFAAGLFEWSGLPSTIARSVEEYVEIAIKVANDAELRRELHTQLLEKSDEMLENRHSVEAWEEYFLSEG
jgi:predicted O-linked N-acetylglucosamine transferase (SPINDLY family)